MPLQIRLSQIGDLAAFAARVAAFRQAKLDRHATVGAPREHELVEACAQRVPRGEAPADDAIEDLTQHTVAGFTPAPFPEA